MLEGSSSFSGTVNTNKDKTKIMKVKSVSPQTVILANGPIDGPDKLTHLGSIVSSTDQDVEVRL